MQLNYFLNTIFSLHMVVAFLVAVILDNTVPGSKQERGVYVWSEPEVARREPAVANDYELPLRVGKIFRWVKWVGLWMTKKSFIGWMNIFSLLDVINRQDSILSLDSHHGRSIMSSIVSWSCYRDNLCKLKIRREGFICVIIY